jgi:hypothetical protein
VFFDSAEELGSLVEQGSVGGVEVLRASPIGVGEIRVPAADEPENPPTRAYAMERVTRIELA